MKKHIPLSITLVMAIIFMLPACFQPGQNEFVENKTDELNTLRPDSVIVQEGVQALNDLAQISAASLSADTGVLAIIYEEIGKRFDGDTEVLFKTIKDRLLKNGQSIEAQICSAIVEQTGNLQLIQDINAKISKLEAYAPLQIYMPDYEKWDGTTVPLIGFVPIDKDENVCDEITAYDNEGNPHIVNSINYHDRPLLIFGLNERVNGTAISGLVTTKADPAPHYYNSREVALAIKIHQTHEPFYKGKPEVFIKAFRYGAYPPITGEIKLENVDQVDVLYMFGEGLDLFPWLRDYWEYVQVGVFEDDHPLADPDDRYAVFEVKLSDENGKWYKEDGEVDLQLGWIVPPDIVIAPPVPLSPIGWLPRSMRNQDITFTWQLPPYATGSNFVFGEYQADIDNVIITDMVDNITGTTYTFHNESGLEAETWYGWRVQVYNSLGKGPNSTFAKFMFHDTPTPPPTPTPRPTGQYILTVRIPNSAGGVDETPHFKLTIDSIVDIQAPLTLFQGSNGYGQNLKFAGWLLNGNAVIDNPSSASTKVREFRGDTSVTAQYVPITQNTPSPVPTFTPKSTPTPTSTPLPVYSVRVNYSDANGAGKSDTYNMKPNESKSIYVPPEFAVGNPNGVMYRFKFSSWSVSGSVTVAPLNSPSTTISNVKSNCSITAMYTQY